MKTTQTKIRIPYEALQQIAASYLTIETLDIRKRDCLDFHEVSVWSLKGALEAAYTAGYLAAKKGGN